jgi:peptide/nickel transport system ATP-binding protein
VLKGGRVVGTGTAEQIFGDPVHPHTRELLAAIPGRRAAGGAGTAV